jgi:hypothetical protein
MAQVTYRANLSAKAFPFISDNWGRTVIVGQYDNTFNRELSSQEDMDRDVGIPQAYYMHNVMPTAQGFQSVGYTTILRAGPALDFTSIHLIRDASDLKVYLGITNSGNFYINSGAGWALKGSYPGSSIVTTAFVAGTQYIYIANYGCIVYDFVSETFSSVTLTGLDATKVIGITGAVGYLIAWSVPVSGSSKTFTTTSGLAVLTGADTSNIIVNQVVSGTGITVGSYVIAVDPGVSITLNQPATASGTVSLVFTPQAAVIAWSSTIDPTDFTPSLVTGAGGGSVEGARGAITLCVAHTLGFIVYTTNNAVAAIYSNNARYPFTFREILSSGGLASQDLVGYDANTGAHYAYTTSGLQIVSTNQTQTIFPEITDFISGRIFEDYDETTQQFQRQTLSSTMAKKINVIADRYLIVSYGVAGLTHAIVYDISQKRFGKFKIPHVATIEYQLTSAGITEIPKQSIGFLQADGTLKIVDFNAQSPTSVGVIALGKYQFVRARLLQLDTISLENIYNHSSFNCTVLSSLDGKTQQQSDCTILPELSSSESVTYGARAAGINHSLILTGCFYLETLVLQFNIHGKR